MINMNTINYNQSITLNKTPKNNQISKNFNVSIPNLYKKETHNHTSFSGKVSLNTIKSAIAKLNLEMPYSPINIRRYYAKRDITTAGAIKQNELLKNPIIKKIFDCIETKFKNYRTTAPNVLRGSLVTCEYDINRLKQKGVTDIVSFYHEAPPEKLVKHAKDVGVTYHHIPLNEKYPPNKEQINKLFSIYDNLQGKMYGHCYHGKDRTGTMMFLIETEKLGRSPEKALDHMINAGHNFIKYPAHLEYLAKQYPTISKYTDVLLKK